MAGHAVAVVALDNAVKAVSYRHFLRGEPQIYCCASVWTCGADDVRISVFGQRAFVSMSVMIAYKRLLVEAPIVDRALLEHLLECATQERIAHGVVLFSNALTIAGVSSSRIESPMYFQMQHRECPGQGTGVRLFTVLVNMFAYAEEGDKSGDLASSAHVMCVL